MKKKFDAVIFDLDGTLLDTLDDLADSVNEMLLGRGYKLRTVEEVRDLVGNGASRLIELCVPDGKDNPEFEKCLLEFKDQYKKNMHNKTTPYTGIPELLSELADLGIKMAVVSNKGDSAVKKMRERYFDQFIKVAVGESDKLRKKPAPDSVYVALEQMDAVLGHTLYVGDSEVDVQTARNAGLPCVAVTWGFRDRALLEKEGADWIIDSPQELIDILEKKKRH